MMGKLQPQKIKSTPGSIWIQLDMTSWVCWYCTWCSCSVWRCWQPFGTPDRAGWHLDSLPPAGTEQWRHVRTITKVTRELGSVCMMKLHRLHFDLITSQGCYSSYSAETEDYTQWKSNLFSVPQLTFTTDRHLSHVCVGLAVKAESLLMFDLLSQL